MLIDYHLHNQFSPDGHASTVELLEAERKNGIRHVCFTNHAEWFEKKEEVAGAFIPMEAEARFGEVQKELEASRPRFPDMDIRFGAEIQYQKKHMGDLAKFIEATPFDFILGSVHIIDGILISGGRHAGEAFGAMDEETAFSHYFDDMLKLVEWGHFSAVAHFDICKKFGHLYYGPFKPAKFKPQILKILKAMESRGIGLELNAGSLHKNCKELFPHPQILTWALEAGIQDFTFGSDAHEVARAGTYIKEVWEIAKEVGINTISTYDQRKPTRHGI
jgi:histidinol-phosphatase (PHP family)